MKIKEILEEAFDSTYRIYRVGNGEYSFETDEGAHYTINFYTPSHTMAYTQRLHNMFDEKLPDDFGHLVEVDFSLEGSPSGKLGYKFGGGGRKMMNGVEGNVMQIYATVLNTLFWYAHSHHVDTVVFEGDSQLGNVYQRFIKRYLPSGWKYVSVKRGTTQHFICSKLL